MTQVPENRQASVSTEEDGLRQQAVDRIKKRRDLKSHAVTYVVVNIALWAVWGVIAASSGTRFPWPAFVTVFWGMGLATNAWEVYGRRPLSEDEVQRECE